MQQFLFDGSALTRSARSSKIAAMNSQEVEQILMESGALLEGHFLLSSGRHSNRYIEKFRVLEQPRLASRLCGEIARRFNERDIECVVGPVTGGIILAFDIARHLGCRAVYAERSDDGNGFTFRRGFQLRQGERVLVVEDIVTTGGSAQKVVDVVRAHGGEVVGVGLLCDRSGGKADFGTPIVESLLKLNIESYAPDEVPAWISEKYGAAIKPGSTSVPAKNLAATPASM